MSAAKGVGLKPWVRQQRCIMQTEAVRIETSSHAAAFAGQTPQGGRTKFTQDCLHMLAQNADSNFPMPCCCNNTPGPIISPHALSPSMWWRQRELDAAVMPA